MMKLIQSKALKRFAITTAFLSLCSVPAYADYNCNVYLSANSPDGSGREWSHDVPDFRTTGWKGIRLSGYSYGNIFEHYTTKMQHITRSRAQNCAVEVSQKIFGTPEKVVQYFDEILDVENNVNAKTLYCTRESYFIVGGEVNNGISSVTFNTQKVMNRNQWVDFYGHVKPPQSYCRSYYPEECFDPSLAPDDEGGLAPLGPDVIDDLYEGPDSHEEQWEQAQENATNTEPTYPEGYTPPPDYCEPKPFELITPDEGWTLEGQSASYPVDINGDFLSDIVMRRRTAQEGVILRTQLSNGDGTFDEVDYISGERFLDTFGVLSGYFDANETSDLLLRDREPGVGMIFHTKLSNGDGTFVPVRHVDGDEKQKRQRLAAPAMVGDVDGDRLSDIVVTYRTTAGLQIGVKFSNGDGTFRATNENTGEGFLTAARLHLADINKDKKSDLVQTYMGANGLSIRSYVSRGDGTFERKTYNSGVWFNTEKFQSFVADVNRDKRTDIIILHRTPAGDLFANTYIGNGDGSFQSTHDHIPEGESVDKFDAVVADVNGDQRSDILLRKRDPNLGLIFVSMNSDGDGQYTRSEYVSSDGSGVDAYPMLLGNYDRGTHTDIGLMFSHPSRGLVMRTKLGGWITFSAEEYDFGTQPTAVNLSALSGPLRWNGGGTFYPVRTGTGTPISISGTAKVIELAKPDSDGSVREVFEKKAIVQTDINAPKSPLPVEIDNVRNLRKTELEKVEQLPPRAPIEQPLEKTRVSPKK